ncbi:MAG: DUF4303 domain-containing protein [Cyanobacteriota bacterium]|nr:DUF4303 domain-containing protein [Cyanobacteriota bacterium]
MIDWRPIQATLFALVWDDIEAFAPQHRSEEFYGLFLDCDSNYGEVNLCLNTPALLRHRAETYKNDLQSIRGSAVPPDLYARETVAEIEEKLRWSPGDWGYRNINRWNEWRKGWNPIRTKIEDARNEDESVCEQFMVMACRVLVQIEESSVLNHLARTPDFATMCADHDETDDASRDRLSSARKAATGG